MKLKLLWLLILAAIVVLVSGSGAANSQASRSAPEIRIGTFNTRSLALAYWRSDAGLAQINATVNRAKTARQNGCDMMQLKLLEDDCRSLQDGMMAEVFGNAPIDDVMPKLRDVLPIVAKQYDVVAIVPQVSFVSDGVETVDVTNALAAAFKPSAKTCRMMADLPKHPCAALKIANDN